MSEMDIVFAKINVVKNCLMAIEKATKTEKDPEFLLHFMKSICKEPFRRA